MQLNCKICVVFTLILYAFKPSFCQFSAPEQVHLSYGALPSQMIVTWTTFEPTNKSIVQYGVSKLNIETDGNITKFVDGGSLKRVIYIHRVVLNDLKPVTIYNYKCGSAEAWSYVFRFQTKPLGDDWSPRLIVFGDMGVSNDHSLNYIIKDVQKGMYDAVLHVGDMAYDMHHNQGTKADEFMRKIEPVAANIPYMTCVGNHEQAYNFSHYVNRFTMMNLEGQINNHFYSFNLGRAHFVAFSTEFYFYTQYGTQQKTNQYRWLVNDLKNANLLKNRAKRPWIITFAHRPMYCSTLDNDDCRKQKSIVRNAVEDLFYKYNVDLEIWAHEHTYERMFPVYNEKTYNGSYDEPYTNAKAPVHIISGAAGCPEQTDKFVNKSNKFSAFRSSDYGYSRLNIINSTHLHMEQVSDNQDGKVIDSMLMIKEVPLF